MRLNIKRFKWLGTSSGAIAAVLLFSACATKPGIEVLSKPVTRSAGADLVIDGKTYSPVTRAVLKQEGLYQLARKDPAGTVQNLAQRLKADDRPEFRLAAAEVSIHQAFRNYRAKTGGVFGYLLTAIELSEKGLPLENSTVHANLVEIYNEANAELAWLLHQHVAGNQKIKARGPLGDYVLAWAKGQRDGNQPGFYDTLTPASRIKVKGFERVNVRPGVGGSLVGYRGPTPERRAKDPFMPPHSGYALALTAVVEWGKERAAKVVLHDLVEDESVTVGGKSYILAGDFTAALATATNVAPPASAGWVGMMKPTKNTSFDGLYTLEPYRDDRIPLILVHGLLSSPMTWREVINQVYADPVIRKNYQPLVFFYPTGFPISVNAAKLRDELKAFQKRYDPQRSNPKMRDMVMVGHSMGCNLTNFQIHDGGDEFWAKFFSESITELDVTADERERLRRSAYFKANPDISRVVFICGPHRGSPVSNTWLGRFGANLIRLPLHTVNELSGSMLSSTTALGQSVFDEPSSSINNLKENSPILLALLEQPMPYKPKMHSIIGDRGKGSGKGSSDGVVPYWSSHLDGVHSEYFIPASHTSATNDPSNVEHIRAVLYEHVGERVPASCRKIRP
ncbi:esterase/lipase family protein [Rubritalea profundi]|uniref:AB hydrolase-1 domain-containing protein n=1 Tax=Rubritalea profundi TaxID=1658618 RepID=A0A2S7U0D8_9BACT|nr:hypothetical protein [Rubritalea profundi]PQJ28469.1 hypothetical protein BSZ32_08055 [Rubritalea profundi]